jgi:mycothiol S-conjugate amidase
VTAWVDVSAQLDRRWAAFRAHVTQISDENPFVRFGRDAWAEFWHREAFVRRETRVPAPDLEDDLFAGLEGLNPGPYGWGTGADAGAAGGAP